MANLCPVCNNPVGPEDSACPHCGFKLQGSTQRFAPLQFGEDQLVAAAKTKPTAVLHVVRGPQTGVSFKLGDQKLSIGRSPQCDIFLNDTTRTSWLTATSCKSARSAWCTKKNNAAGVRGFG